MYAIPSTMSDQLCDINIWSRHRECEGVMYQLINHVDDCRLVVFDQSFTLDKTVGCLSTDFAIRAIYNAPRSAIVCLRVRDLHKILRNMDKSRMSSVFAGFIVAESSVSYARQPSSDHEAVLMCDVCMNRRNVVMHAFYVMYYEKLMQRVNV